MKTIELARKLARAGERESACRGFLLALREADGTAPAEELEAAFYLLQFGEDYRAAYSVFLDLHRRGAFQDDVFAVMDEAFYRPNVKLTRSRYEKNCKLLAKYPYFFRKDFIPFDKLPIRFFPYDDGSYVPYYTDERRFGDYINPKDKRVTHHFFHDLENPILAEDVYSEYELEYLNDTVRASEDVGRENHIYLHYTDWGEFCSRLACLNLRRLLQSKKLVFLIEDEKSLYPIDFKERFGIDYGIYGLKPVRIREVNRMIWHTQLSFHNGGDFFNEIFDAHPNLLVMSSMMMSSVEKTVADIRDVLNRIPDLESAFLTFSKWPRHVAEELFHMRGRTDKDILVAMYMVDARASAGLDRASRIVPALFFQPHFSNVLYGLRVDQAGRAIIYSSAYENIRESPIFQNFKYIKTFTPMRRMTTSHAGTVQFMDATVENDGADKHETYHIVSDAVTERVLNRTFMVDPEDRLYHDGILVRFEDSKLNPKATFTALAAFLDLPYDEASMTRCTLGGEELYANGAGFHTGSVYRNCDKWMNASEGAYIEYFLRDVYYQYGYDFQYYDGQPVDEERVRAWLADFGMIDSFIKKSWGRILERIEIPEERLRENPDAKKIIQADAMKNFMDDIMANREKNTKILMGHMEFFNQNGQPLRMMPMLELNLGLLEREVYH